MNFVTGCSLLCFGMLLLVVGATQVVEAGPTYSDRGCGLETNDTSCGTHTCKDTRKICARVSEGSCSGC
jgi:hypothetical protein